MNQPQDNTLRNIVIAGVVLLMALCCCGTLITATNIGLRFYQPAAPAATEAPAAEKPAVSEPITSALNTDCGKAWDTSAKTTQFLLPGFSARGDVKANGVAYYDSGVGEGTTIINNSSKPVEIYSEWGSGCEASVDLKYLVNKDLGDGCGSACKVARVVIFRDGQKPEQKFYTEPIK